MYIATELWQMILDHCNLSDQLSLICVEKRIKNKLYVKRLYNTCPNLLKRLTDKILRNPIYSRVVWLDASFNKQITNVNHLIYLDVLNCSNSGIGDEGIKNLVNLKVLIASHYRGPGLLHSSIITDKGLINMVKLQCLDVSGNTNVTNVNHMTCLKTLNASHGCGIDDNGIKDLVNLKKLYMLFNDKITNIDHMEKLEILDSNSPILNFNFYFPKL